MVGAFLLPALSPEDGIPVVQAGSCSAALHCDEFSTDVSLLSLLSTLPVLLFSPACLQPRCSHFLYMSCLLLFSMLLLNFCVLFWYGLYLCECAHIFLTMLCLFLLFLYNQSTTDDVNWKISSTAVNTENLCHPFIWPSQNKTATAVNPFTYFFLQLSINTSNSNRPL